MNIRPNQLNQSQIFQNNQLQALRQNQLLQSIQNDPQMQNQILQAAQKGAQNSTGFNQQHPNLSYLQQVQLLQSQGMNVNSNMQQQGHQNQHNTAQQNQLLSNMFFNANGMSPQLVKNLQHPTQLQSTQNFLGQVLNLNQLVGNNSNHINNSIQHQQLLLLQQHQNKLLQQNTGYQKLGQQTQNNGLESLQIQGAATVNESQGLSQIDEQKFIQEIQRTTEVMFFNIL